MWNKKIQKLAQQEIDGMLPSILFPHAVYYVDQDGCILCANCANQDKYEDSIFDVVDYGLVENDNTGRGISEENICQNCDRPIDPALR